MLLPILMGLYPQHCANLMNDVFWINGFNLRYTEDNIYSMMSCYFKVI